jgi:hypothetical protein
MKCSLLISDSIIRFPKNAKFAFFTVAILSSPHYIRPTNFRIQRKGTTIKVKGNNKHGKEENFKETIQKITWRFSLFGVTNWLRQKDNGEAGNFAISVKREHPFFHCTLFVSLKGS